MAMNRYPLMIVLVVSTILIVSSVVIYIAVQASNTESKTIYSNDEQPTEDYYGEGYGLYYDLDDPNVIYYKHDGFHADEKPRLVE